jgi:hypothetical protein
MLVLAKGEQYTGVDALLLFIRVAIGGPFFGWLAGKVMVRLPPQKNNKNALGRLHPRQPSVVVHICALHAVPTVLCSA